MSDDDIELGVSKKRPGGPSLRMLLNRYAKELPNGCIDHGRADTHDGYAQITVSYNPKKARPIHQVSWEVANDKSIPNGFEINHLCENKRCINPDHLEPATKKQNKLYSTRKFTHCKNGHEYTPDNIYDRGKGWRECLQCRRDAAQRANRRRSTKGGDA